MSWTIDEWFVIALARTIRPRETVFHGFGSPCAQVAMHVARRTHAPDMTLVEGAMYAVNPDPPFIPPTSNDASLSRGAAYSMRFEEFFDAAIRGDVDRMFLSGGQIDGFGNTNVTAIGPAGWPKVKLGGGGGGCNLSATIGAPHRCGPPGTGPAARWWSPATSSPTSGTGPRWAAGPSSASPAAGRSGWSPSSACSTSRDGRARLVQIFPDVSVADVRTATGFPLEVAGDLRTVPPPSTAELATVRSVDPLKVRTSEFSRRELDRAFERGGGQDCAC